VPLSNLVIDTVYPFFGPLYFRVNSADPEIYTVVEITVLVCNGMSFVSTDPTDPVFDIVRDAALVSTFESFDVTDLFETFIDGVIPQGKCPINDIIICRDNLCVDELNELDGFRVVNSTALEV